MLARLLLLLAFASALPAAAQQARAPRLDVPYEGTPPDVVLQMLRLANVTASDVVLDLGCGDGRIPVAAAKQHGARALCVDLDPRRVREANANVARNGVGDRVVVREGNLFETDLAEATVITLFLWPTVNLKLRPKLLALAPGTRVVSLDHDMGDWRPDRHEVAPHKSIGPTPLYLWIVPARVAGRWRFTVGETTAEAELRQTHQFFAGTAPAAAAVVRNGRLDGTSVRLDLRPARGGWRQLSGRVTGPGAMAGDGWSASRL